MGMPKCLNYILLPVSQIAKSNKSPKDHSNHSLMMGALKNTYPPASLYNQIPFIHDMEHVAETYADDLAYLRGLLATHNMPTSVCVKLLHIHFHLHQGEVLAVRELDASPYGKIPFLEPVTSHTVGEVYGCNYIVDESGDLQAFEYTTIKGDANLAAYPAFVSDFCAAIVQRGLQYKFGLAINSGTAEIGSWMELDYPEKRATFLLPSHVPLPQNERLTWRKTITKFPRLTDEKSPNVQVPTHVHVEHTWGQRKDVDGEWPVDGVTTKNGLHLTGIPLEPDTAFYRVASAIAAVG